jgi:hypothetical protein
MSLVIDTARLAATTTQTQPVVAGRSGEIVVEIENRGEAPLYDVAVRLREATRSESGGGQRLSTIPPFDDGYHVDRIAGRARRQWTFAVRPLVNEAGLVVPMDLQVESLDEVSWERRLFRMARGESHGMEHLQPERVTGTFTVEIEARPEVYVAIGALELARRWVEKGYEGLKELGRDTHRALQTTLPGEAPIEPARVALSEDSFRGLFEVIGMGVRVFEAAKRNFGSEGSGGGSSS